MDKINKLNSFYDKLQEVSLESKRAIDMQEKIIINLMKEYQEIAKWYVDKGMNYDFQSPNGDKILIARNRNNEYGDVVYLWDPKSMSIESFGSDSFSEGTMTPLKELLSNRHFKEIVKNIKALEYSLKDNLDHEEKIKNELFSEIDDFEQLYL